MDRDIVDCAFGSVPTAQASDVSTPTHTPGPWKACGTIYEHMNAEIRSGRKGEGQGLAQVWDGPNAFKDALLMAAAPEMLKALMEARVALHDHYVEWDGEPEDAVALQLARAACDAAIAKATGAA